MTDSPWFIHVEKQFQRAGTDDEPVFFHEKMVLEPGVLHLLDAYRTRETVQGRNQAVMELEEQLGRQVLSMILRFLDANELVQDGSLTAETS